MLMFVQQKDFFSFALATGLFFLFLSHPVVASAQLVQCSGNTCGTCDLVQLANNGTDFIIVLALGIATIIFMYAGFLMLSSGGSESKFKKGTSMMTNVLIGLIIILTAWLVIDIMLKSLLPGGQVNGLPWNQIACSTQNVLSDSDPNQMGQVAWAQVAVWQNIGNTVVLLCDATPAGNTDCTSQRNSCIAGGGSASVNTTNSNRYTVSCVSTTQAGPGSNSVLCSATPNGAYNDCSSQINSCIGSGGSAQVDPSNANSYYVVCTPMPQAPSPSGNLVSYGGRQFDSSVLSYVQYIDQNFGLSLTSGYRSPTQNANANGSPTSYHLLGRAADFVGTQSQMQAAQQWAQQNGAVEALIHNAGSGTHLHVAW